MGGNGSGGAGMGVPVPAAPRRGPLGWLFDLFSSVWLGVTLLTLLFIFCSIGSALPQVRELPALELTEFEWFHWWPFDVLIVLTGLNLVTVTIRRIPLRWVNAGVWTIHTGIIILLLGSYRYFGTKVEGDTPVFRRYVRIEMPGLSEPRMLPALPGSAIQFAVGPDLWTFEVESTNSQWPILSGDDKGKNAHSVNVSVTPPTGLKFIRQLLTGYPQYTEDIIPGQGRAIKAIGKKLVDDQLTLSMDLAPQEHFHVMKTWALFVRKAGERTWVERKMEGMPRYHDRIGSREQVFYDSSSPPPLLPMDLEVPPPPGGDALGNASVRVTSYLRYAQIQQRWREGGEAFNPVLRVLFRTTNQKDSVYDLVALDPARRQVENGSVEFMWLDDPAKIAQLPADSRAILGITVPKTGFKVDLPLIPSVIVGREGPFTPLEGTEFSYRVLNVMDNLAMPDGRPPVSIAMVEIKTPEGTFTRMVADRPESTRDVHGDGDPHAGGRRAEESDPRVVMTYRPRSAPILLAGHPRGLHLVVNGQEGRMLSRELKIGEEVEVIRGLSLKAEAMWMRAALEEKPFVVPFNRRDRGMEESLAMIRLEVGNGPDLQSKWLQYNAYALPGPEFAYPGRLTYMPQRFRAPDGSTVEVLFSRQRLRLPHAVAMEDFELDTHVGGYSGSVSTIRNYVSRLRFRDGSNWTEPLPTAVNQPTEFGGYWFFQSMWDRPQPDDPGGGMNYTGLGVGNRLGVYTQLAGCCISVAGMIFAFYVKPVIQRRRRERAMAKVSSSTSEADALMVSGVNP